MTELESRMAEITRALSALRVPSTPGEYDLHRLIAGALDAAGIAYAHEARIAPWCRVDFLVGDIGIEVKKGHVAAGALKAQAAKYLASSALSALLIVTTRGATLPGMIGGKPLRVFGLNRLWGVAL